MNNHEAEVFRPIRSYWKPEWTEEKNKGIKHLIRSGGTYGPVVKTYCGKQYDKPAPAALLVWESQFVTCQSCLERIRNIRTRVPGWKQS